MSTVASANQSLSQEAVVALQAGHAQKARELFERVIEMGQADTVSWLGLAFACAQLDDNAATLQAVEKSLQLEPRNLRAILFKADHLQHRGESRQAMEIYQQALGLAMQADELPDDIRQGLKRAQQACDSKDREYKAFLAEKMKAEGISLDLTSRRFQQSLEIMSGEKEVYYQQPSRYYFPGLPQTQFYEREQFDWVQTIESATDDIRRELVAAMNNPSSFSPYLRRGETALDHRNAHLLDNNDWGALFLWDYGRLVPESAKLFPQTVKALEAAPLPVIPGQAPMALFSKLTPGTRIPPHNGLLNTRLICHLPVIVPENCGALRVGNEERPWVEGELLIFDDSIEHEAWNTSKEARVILLFEIWRPELSEEERHHVIWLLAAVKEFYNDRNTGL